MRLTTLSDGSAREDLARNPGYTASLKRSFMRPTQGSDNAVQTAETKSESHAAPAPSGDAYAPKCRFCATPLAHTFVDLGTSPLCNRQVTAATFNHAEAVYPLHVYVCDRCWLVQLPSYVAASEIFDDQYTYFSSFSES